MSGQLCIVTENGLKEMWLRFPSKSVALQLLLNISIKIEQHDEERNVVHVDRPGVWVYYSGLLYEETGATVMLDGEEAPEIVPQEGWFVNLIGDLTDVEIEALTPYASIPETPDVVRFTKE